MLRYCPSYLKLQIIFVHLVIDLSMTKETKIKLSTDNFQGMLLEAHNFYRRKENASDMQSLEWNNHLAYLAWKVAQSCRYDHQDIDHLGQNLFATSIPDEEGFNFWLAVEAWYDEKSDYDYMKNSCKTTCGHYTQLVWAETKEVGCSYAICNPLKKSGLKSMSYFIVCNYKPSGNEDDMRPFTRGSPCSKCFSLNQTCTQGLCSDYEEIREKFAF